MCMCTMCMCMCMCNMCMCNMCMYAHRLGGVQKGTPLEVVASGGKLWSSCAMRCVKYDSNLRRAQPMHSGHVALRSAMSRSYAPPLWLGFGFGVGLEVRVRGQVRFRVRVRVRVS